MEGCQETDGEEVLLCKSPRARLGFQAAVSGEESSADTPLSSPRDGVSPTVTVSSNTATEYKLTITDQNGSITTPNLMGPRGPEGGITLTRYTYPLDWDYMRITDSVGGFLGHKMWATIGGDNPPPADLWDRAISIQISAIEGLFILTVPVFGASIPGVESPPFGFIFVSTDDKTQREIMMTGDEFLELAAHQYETEGQEAFKNNWNYVFQSLIVIAADEIGEG